MEKEQFLATFEELQKPANDKLLTFVNLLIRDGKTKKEIAKAIRKRQSVYNPEDTTIVSRRLEAVCNHFDIKFGRGHSHQDNLVHLFRQHMPDFVHPDISPDGVDSETLSRPQSPTNPQNIPNPEPISELKTLGRDHPLIFSGGETFVQDIIDQINNSLEIGSRLRVVCSPRYSEPLFLSEGKLPLSENDKIREQDIIKKFDINYTNDACAAVVTRPNWSDSPLTIRYCTCKYAEILSLRNSIPYVGIITANVLLFCEELRCIVVHRRSKKSRDYPSTLHTFGGAFIPSGADHQSPHQEDRLGIQHTGIREISEEAKAGIDISESVPIIVTDEFEIQSIEITYLGVSVTARQVRRMLGNWEGDPVQIGFDELEEKLANINEWVPSGWVHILLWLSCNTPSANSPIKFGGLSGSELASATVKRCLAKPSKKPPNKLLM